MEQVQSCALDHHLGLGLQAFSEGVSGGFYNCIRASIAASHLEEVVVAPCCDVLTVAADGAVELVEDAVILI